MKFTLQSGALAEAIAAGISSVPSRPINPILGGVLVEAQVGAVTLSSFNYDRATMRVVAADVADTDTAVVSGRLLAAVGANLPKTAECTATTSGNHMVITAGRSEYRLPLMHAEDYPRLPEMTTADVIGTVDAAAFSDAVRAIGGYSSTDLAVPALTALNFVCTPAALTLTATDRFMIGRRRLDWSGSTETSFNAVAADILSTIKALSDASEIEILANGNLIGFRTPSTTVVSPVLDEDFPSVGRFLESQDYSTASIVKTSELVSMLKRATAIASDTWTRVKLVADDGTLTMMTSASETGGIVDAIEADHAGRRRELTLSARRLHSAMAAVDEPMTTLAFKETGNLVHIYPGASPTPLTTPSVDTVAILIGMRA